MANAAETRARELIAKYPNSPEAKRLRQTLERREGVEPPAEPAKPTRLESTLRGAADWPSYGTAPLIEGYGRAAIDTLSGKPWEQSRDQRLQESRQAFKAAEEENPWSYAGGGLVATAALPFMSVSQGLSKLPYLGKLAGKGLGAMTGRGVVEGATYGAGTALAQGDPNLLDKAESGAMVGGATTALLGGLGKGAVALGRSKPLQKAAEFVANVFADIPPEVSKTLMKDPKKFTEAPRLNEIVDNIVEAARKLRQKLIGANKEADELLSRDPLYPIDAVKDLVTSVYEKGGALKQNEAGQMIVPKLPSLRRAYRSMRNVLDHIDDLGIDEHLSERELRRLIKDVRHEINWGSKKRQKANDLLSQTQFELDRVLKTNPEYAQFMQPFAEDSKLYENLVKEMRLSKQGGDLFASDATVSGLNTYLQDVFRADRKKPQLAGRLQSLGSSVGEDFGRQLQGARLQQLSEQSIARGSKRATPAALAGFAGGTAMLGPFGGVPGAVAGYTAGAALDQYGRKGATYALTKLGPKLASADKGLQKIFSVVPEKYREMLSRSLEKGMQSFIVTHYTLSNIDPKYREQTKDLNIEDFSQ